MKSRSTWACSQRWASVFRTGGWKRPEERIVARPWVEVVGDHEEGLAVVAELPRQGLAGCCSRRWWVRSAPDCT